MPPRLSDEDTCLDDFFEVKFELHNIEGEWRSVDCQARSCTEAGITTVKDISEQWAHQASGPTFGSAYFLKARLPFSFDRAHPIFTAAEEIGLSIDHLYAVLLYATLRLGDFDVDDPPCPVTILPAIN